MKTALLTGLAAFALGATCATALTGTGSAASVATPVASRTPADDTCTGAAASSPSCVVERVLTLDPAAPTASPSASAATATAGAADDDGTPDQGRGDRPAVATTAPSASAAPAVKLRGDGSVDDSQPGTTSTRTPAGDDDGTPDQGRGDRPARSGDDDGDDRSGRRGGDDRSGSSDDDRNDHDEDRDEDRDDDRWDDDSRDDDGTADQGSGDR